MNYPAIPREFFNGDCFDAYRILGAHPCSDNGTEGWRFAVWALSLIHISEPTRH